MDKCEKPRDLVSDDCCVKLIWRFGIVRLNAADVGRLFLHKNFNQKTQ